MSLVRHERPSTIQPGKRALSARSSAAPRIGVFWLVLLTISLGLGSGVLSAQQASLEGTVVDQLGGGISRATIVLTKNGQKVTEVASDSAGAFVITVADAGRYGLEVVAPGFLPATVEGLFLSGAARVPVTVPLSIGITQAVVVTASAEAAPSSQVAAAVTVIDRATLESSGKADVSDALRLVPGAQVVAAGGRGSTTSMFVRGGTSSFNKVLIDGVPVNDIGGVFDFGDLDTGGVDRIEVLRNANSVLHGNDALAGVVSISTARGRTRTPEARYSIDAGTLGTGRHDMSVGGSTDRIDYFAGFSHVATDNDVPNNAYTRNNLAARVGAAVSPATDVTAVFRAARGTSGLPNATAYYGLADDSTRTSTTRLFSLAADSRVSPRVKTSLRYAVVRSDYSTTNPAPTGEYFDPFGFGGNYLGTPVTITGANGYRVTGQAILDYGGSYPSPFDAGMTRHLVSGQSTFRLNTSWSASGGARIEHERGFSVYAGSRRETHRLNSGAFAEVQGMAGVAAVTAGVGVDDNAVFGFAVSPRASLAVYLRKPSVAGTWGDTRVIVNAGRGIKAPTLSQELDSLYGLVNAAVSGVEPIGPERSRAFDVGLEQAILKGRLRVRAAYFNNTFSDLIEYVSKSALTRVGVTAEAAAATQYGAYVNAQSYEAQGIEMSSEARVGALSVRAAYMYLAAEVTRSFSGGVLEPAENPAFPGIKIGQYAPLVGARPFRRPAHSGSLLVGYARGPLLVSVSGYFSGRQDDSTFLTDAYFGYSMLLPNQNLGAAFQKVDLAAGYALHPRARWYVSVDNLLNQRYEAAAGFPALPMTARTGITLSVGGTR